MDFLNKAKEQMSGGNSATGGQQPAPAQNAGQGQQDYGDKGLDFLEKKTGHQMGGATNEKITDGARGMYEKATGYVIFVAVSLS